jgi:hypothetical protein
MAGLGQGGSKEAGSNADRGGLIRLKKSEEEEELFRMKTNTKPAQKIPLELRAKIQSLAPGLVKV